jgi:hypothetical protein
MAMASELEKLAKEMIHEAKGVLGHAWPQVRAFAEAEMKKIALSVLAIEEALAKGELTEPEARALLDIQKNASRAVLTASKVVGIVEAEKAINAALAILTGPLKKVLGIVAIA